MRLLIVIRNVVTFIAVLFVYHIGTTAADTYYVAKNGNNGNDGRLVSSGGTGPWLTIQYASGILKAGDTLYVRAGTYNEPYPSHGSTKSNGIRPKYAGTNSLPITYAAYPNEHVVIDPNFASPCFYIDKSYTVIRGFDITRCDIVGVWVTGADNVTVEDNHIHNINGSSGTNTAGVRFDSSGWSKARNNLIHDVYHAGALNLTSNSNNNGVNSYYGHNITIENNEIYNTSHGIYHKMADPSSRKGFTIRNNKIHGVYSALRWAAHGLSDGTSRKHHDAEVYNNLIYNALMGLDLWVMNDIVKHQNLYVYNNTFVNVQNHLFGWDNVQLWNNIFYNNQSNASNQASNDGATISMEVTNAILSASNYNQGTIGYSNYNLFYPKFKVVLGQNGGGDGLREVFTSLSAWNAASNSSHNLSIATPDLQSLNSDPLFDDISQDIYSLKATTPASGKGRYGENIGAYSSDAVQVGPVFNVSVGWVGKGAKAPTNLQVSTL